MQMNGSFNAQQFEPNQGGGGGHPPANKVPFRITSCSIKENSKKDGGFFEVEFTSPQGSIIMRYNIWNQSPKAVEIAHGQLSALCRAVNIYNINWQDEGKALMGAQGLMDVGYQKGEEPSAANPDAKGYTELKRVYDMAGNDPSKPGQQAQPQPVQPAPQQNGAQPMTQQPGGGWGQAPATQQQPQPNPSQQAPNPSWQGGGNPQAQPTQQSAGQGAWQPGQNGAAAGTPPWGPR